MPTPEPIALPADRLALVARQAASTAKTVASVMSFFLALFIIAAIAMIAGKTGGSTTERTMDGGSMIVGLVIWLVLIGGITSHFLKTAKRSSEVARLSGANVGHQFFLAGKQVLVRDMAGGKLPDLTFNVSSKHRAALLEVPRATVVPPRA